jgi:Zn-dependent protease with chaperone function
MTLPYLLRLMCLCFACFFLLHLAIGAAVSLLVPAVLRRAEQMRPRQATRVLLAVRLLPPVFSAVVVLGLCAPSYLLLEPVATNEEVGWGCLAAALLCAASFALSIYRGWNAGRRSIGYVRYCQLVGRQELLPGENTLVWVIEGSAPFLVLAGILKPRLIISRPVVNALPSGQLAAALCHEEAHRVSRDNFKRLLLLLAPDLFPAWRGFVRLERAWNRFTEWAADDDAVAGDSQRSISLASALVRVARMGACPHTAPLVTSLLADNQDLAERVERLLREAPGVEAAQRQPIAGLIGGLASLAILAVLTMQPATLSAVHRLLEQLTR